ncbi:MAG: NHL repeat-containing protein [Ignavibacteriae bacterium]|nr:NHL repeat-containing protein [Ignavibacteriota bacterium]
MIRLSVLALLAVVFSCRTTQSQLPPIPDTSTLTGTRFDVDINGRLTILDSEKNTIRLVAHDGKLLGEIGGAGWGDNQFDRPTGIWARNGIDIFAADYGNHRIQRFDRNLAFISTFTTRERANADERFGYPTDVAISRLGDMFICDGENLRILRVNGAGKIEKIFGGFDAGKGRLKKPTQIELGPADKVYIRDEHDVVVFDNFGNYIQTLGAGLFSSPAYIYADETGLVVLSESKLFCFDENERLVQTVEVAQLTDATPRAFALSRGKIYFLTSNGVTAAADPRK